MDSANDRPNSVPAQKSALLCYGTLKLPVGSPNGGNGQLMDMTSKTTVSILPSSMFKQDRYTGTVLPHQDSAGPCSIRSSITFEVSRGKIKPSSPIEFTASPTSVSRPFSLRRQMSLSPSPVKSKPSINGSMTEPESSGRVVRRPCSLPIPSQLRNSKRPMEYSEGQSHHCHSLLSMSPSKNQKPSAADLDVLDSSLPPSVTPSSQTTATVSNAKRICPPHSIPPPSPKRQRSATVADNLNALDVQSCSSGESVTSLPDVECSLPRSRLSSSNPRHSCSFKTDDINFSQVHSLLCEPLLHPLARTTDCHLSVSETFWPPLVISVHAELILQERPPPSLLISLLESRNPSINSPPSKVKAPEQSYKMSAGLPFGGPIGNPPDRCVPSIDWVPPGITLAVTRNVFVHVHSTPLDCCDRRPAWCFSSRGFDSLGQDEIVLLVERLPYEDLPPLMIYRFFQCIYLAVTDCPYRTSGHNRVSLYPLSPYMTKQFIFRRFFSLDCFIPCQERRSTTNSRLSSMSSVLSECGTDDLLLDDKWLGCVFFRPTHQCLRGLQLPDTPFLFGLLVHKDESMWARLLPLRFLLRLGKLCRQYPTPLLSDRRRKPVYNGAFGTSVFHLLHKLSPSVEPKLNSTLGLLFSNICRLPDVKLRLLPSDTILSSRSNSSVSLNISLPHIVRSQLSRFLNKLPPDCFSFVLAGGLDVMSDSHLVCIQTSAHLSTPATVSPTDSSEALLVDKQADYVTEAISVPHIERKATGVTFVIFVGDADRTDLKIIEDGILVQLTSTDFCHLVRCLKEFCDVSFSSCPSLGDVANNPNCVVHLNWITSKSFDDCSVDPLDSQRNSWINGEFTPLNGTFVVPLDYQLAPWMLSETADLYKSRELSSVDRLALRLAWTKVHVTHSPHTTTEGSTANHLLNWGELVNHIAREFVRSTRPYLEELRTSNHTRIAVQIRLQSSDLMGYQVSSSVVPDAFMTTQQASSIPLSDLDEFSSRMDSVLLPLLQTWIVGIEPTQELLSSPLNWAWELEFVILD